MHYAQHAQKAPDGSALPDPNAPYGALPPEHVPPPGHPYVHDPAQANDFRARFHRPLVAPSPFRSGVLSGTGGAGAAASSTSSGTPPASVSAASGKSPSLDSPGSATLDPQLGQARDEAAGVADRLSRGD